jgi:hypothetical protein
MNTIMIKDTGRRPAPAGGSISNPNEEMEKLIVHEIGHTLGLRDVFKDEQLGGNPNATRPPSSPWTRSNYMDYIPSRRMNMYFRTQIETIITNLTPPQRR